MANLTDAQKQFFGNAYYAIATTLREDGSPHNTVVWVELEDGVPSFNTALGRAKPRHLEHDSRAALTLVDPNDGKVETTTDGADAQIDRLAKKYMDADTYPFRKEGETRLTVRIRPEHVSSSGLS